MGSRTNSPPSMSRPHSSAAFYVRSFCLSLLFSLFFYTYIYFFLLLSLLFFARFSSAVCARKITQLVNCTNNMSALLQRSFKQGRECATNLRQARGQDERVPTRYRSTGYGLVWSALVWLPVFHHYSSVLKFRWGMKWKHVHQKIASTSSNKTQPQYGLNAWPKVLITHKQGEQRGSKERGTDPRSGLQSFFHIDGPSSLPVCVCVWERKPITKRPVCVQPPPGTKPKISEWKAKEQPIRVDAAVCSMSE